MLSLPTRSLKNKLRLVSDFWWILIALFGLQILFLQRRNFACIPLGITVTFLGFYTYSAQRILSKTSGAMIIILVLLSSMSGIFQSTQTMFAVYVSLTVLLSYFIRANRAEMIGAYLCAVAGICDIFAGLNKLVPSSSFYKGELLRMVLEKNLFPEPAFFIDFLVQASPIIALLEVFCGILLLFFPLIGLIFAIAIHLPIAIFTAESFRDLLTLVSYAAMLFYAVSIQFILASPRKPKPAAILIAREFWRQLKESSCAKGWNAFALHPLNALIAFQLILPAMLLGLRLRVGGGIVGYGFGWQMFS
jgi:hypothetical protein